MRHHATVAGAQLGDNLKDGQNLTRGCHYGRLGVSRRHLIAIRAGQWARPRKRSAAEDERILRKDVIPAWGRRKANDIARKDVIALLDRIIDRGSPVAANRTLAVVRRMFGWAPSRDIIPANPCSAVKAPGKETRRDRVLSADEIAALWRSLDDPATPISRPIRLALKLQLTTAQRKGEVIDAEWSEFDITEGVWTIPAANAKNGMPHRVPLSALALAVLDEVRGMALTAANRNGCFSRRVARGQSPGRR
jgi:integrase